MATIIKSFFLTISVIVLFPLTISAQTELNLSLFQEFTGEAGSDLAGGSVSSAGDVNGDGYDDILVGATCNDDAEDRAGAVYLIYGLSTPLTSASLSTAVEFTGEETTDFAGESVSSAGDVNGDGYDDILVGADFNSDAGNSAGTAYLIYGQASEYFGTISLGTSGITKFTGEVASDFAGESVSSAGDVNGDGYDDILVGATGNDDAGNSAGAVYLIYGSSTPLTSASLSTAIEFTGEAASDRAGTSVSSAGDINNDGYDDMLVGAYFNNDTGNSAGAAYLIYGSSTPLTSSSLSTAIEFTGEAASDRAGTSVSSSGDVNGDGYDDILVGADNNNDAEESAGAAYLIYGSSTPLTPSSLSAAVEFTGEAYYNFAGDSVSLAGDVNGDGYDDILIGAVGNNDAEDRAGAAYLIYGSSTPLTPSSLSAAVEFTGEATYDLAGTSVSSAGDINNDGFNDILIGATGNDDAGSESGAIYLGYLYIDADHDGLAGSSGLFSGTDCNDADATVSTYQTYYEDLDNDGYGSTVTISVCSATPPTGYSTNNTDCNDNDPNIDGTYQVYYQDSDNDNLGSKTATSVCSLTAPAGYVINSLDPDDTKTDTLLQYESNSDYYLVLRSTGKKLSLVNLNANELLKTVTLSKKIKYSTNSLKLLTYRNKKLAVIVSKKKAKILTSLVYPNITKEKLTRKDQVKITNNKIMPSKTKKKNNYLKFRNKNNKVIYNYFVNKNYQLKIR